MASATKTPAKLLSWTLSAALVFSSLPLGAIEAAAQTVAGSAATVSSPLPGGGVAVVPSLNLSQSLGGLSQGLSAPAAMGSVLPAPAATSVSRVTPSVVSPSVAQAVSPKSAPAAASVFQVSPSAASPAVAKSAPAAASVSKVSPSAVSLSLPKSLARPAASQPASQDPRKDGSKPAALASLEQTQTALDKHGASAASTLSTLYQGTRAGGEASDASSPAVDGVAAKGFQGPAGRSGLRKSTAGKLAIGAAAVAAPVAALLVSPLSASAFSLSTVFGFLASVGDWVANGMSFYMAVPQVYQTASKGTASGMPIGRAMLMVGASFALGLINAPVAGSMLWGTQNLFGALVMLATIPVGKWLEKRGKGGLTMTKPMDPSWSFGRKILHRLRYDHALHAALAVAALAAPLSIGLYSAALAFVPGFLAASAAKVTLIVQAVTGMMFLMMFLPDVLAALKGTPSKSFTPGFSLSFFIGSLAFIVWALHTASLQPSFSPTWWQFMIYTAINAVYAVVAFISYRVGTRETKKPS